MTRRDTLLGVLLLCGGAAGVVVPTPHRADDTEDSEGAALLRCVRSVMERNAHGDKPTDADRLFYSHRRYFNRIWGADYLFSEKDGIKYFQIPKSGSTEIRMRMSRQFDIPYRGKGGNSRPGGLSYKFGPGSTPNENRVKPAVLTGEALDWFTFTFVAEPVRRLVHGIEESWPGIKSPEAVGEYVAAYLRIMIDQDRHPTGNWTSQPGFVAGSLAYPPEKVRRRQAHNVHTAGQVTLLMDMFLAATPPKLDFVGLVEQTGVAWNRTLQAYNQYNTLLGVQVDPERYTPKPVRARAPGGGKSHDDAEMWAVLSRDPHLLCDAARMLEFDYECLPTYSIWTWCGSGLGG